MPKNYSGNMIYENNVLKQILIDGGYIAFSGPAHYYYYYLKDHLGNNRVVVSPSGTPLQVNHYYPFGGLFGESTGNSLQRFRFNGKEFDRTHGLDWYDYGARHMTPDVGRFTTIDPMAEKYYNISPYAYCANNPVKYVDLHGDSILKQSGEPLGKHIQGNLGQTLYPNSGLKRSTNGNIQININGRGNINAQSIGIVHEFGHVILHLRRLPSGHRQSGVDSFVYGRASMMSKRLGYDY